MHSPTKSDAAVDLTEFRQSWRILVLSVIGIAISINASLLYGFGTLVIPLEEAFGWDKSSLQASITFLFASAVISLQIVGWLNMRYGMKRVTMTSLVLISIGYLGTTQIEGSIWTLYLAFSVLPLLGMGCLAVTWTQLLNIWFEKNRGLALAIGLSGTGITAAIVPPILSWGIETWDWRAAFVILALMNTAILLPFTAKWLSLPQFLPEASGQDVDAEAVPGVTYREGLVSRKFWTCNIALALVISSIVGMVTSTVPMLRDMGLSAENASLVFSFFGVSLIFGRIAVGYLLDRFWPPAIAAISLALPAIGCLIYLQGGTELVPLMVAAVCVGFGAGAEFDIAAFLIARYFGLKDYGRLFGFHQGLLTVASALAPLLFASLLSYTGGYTAMLIYSLACSIIGPALLMTLGKVPKHSSVSALSSSQAASS